MRLILNYPTPRDWIVATGETRTVRNLCDFVFSYLGLNYEDYVVKDQKYVRPEELQYLRGDGSDTVEIRKWKRKYTFETMVEEMIKYWLEVYS